MSAAAIAAAAALSFSVCTGEKPIVYDREWRMHMPNPNLLRVTAGTGPDAIPRSLVDLVYDCGAYQPEQRPSMREVSTCPPTSVFTDVPWSVPLPAASRMYISTRSFM